MARWQPSKSDMSPRKGYIPEIDYDDYDDDGESNVPYQDQCETCESRGIYPRVNPVTSRNMKFCKDCVGDHDIDMQQDFYRVTLGDRVRDYVRQNDEPGTDSDNKAASNALADTFPGLDDAAKGLMGLSAVSTPRGERTPLNIPMNWEG